MRSSLWAKSDGKAICRETKAIAILLLIAFCVSTLANQAVSTSGKWELLYHQDFEAPADEWSSLEREGLACNYIEGEYEIELKCSECSSSWSVPTHVPLEDFAMEVEFRFLEGMGGVGIRFRFQDRDHFYLLEISSNGGYSVWRKYGEYKHVRYGHWYPVIEDSAIDSFDPSRSHKLRLEAEGSRFRFSLDGQLIKEFVEETFGIGGVGLTVRTYDEPHLKVAIDDLSVWRKNVTTEAEEGNWPIILSLHEIYPFNIEAANWDVSSRRMSMYQVLMTDTYPIFDMEALVSFSDEGEADLIFGYLDRYNFYFAGVDNLGHCRIGRFVEGELQELALGKCAGFSVGGPVYLRAQVRPTDVTLWVNDEKVLDQVRISCGGGKIAVGATFESLEAESLAFSDFKLRMPVDTFKIQFSTASEYEQAVGWESLGDLEKALDGLRKSLELVESTQWDSFHWEILNRLAQLYSSLGNYRSCLQMLDQAVTVALRLGHPLRVATTYLDLGFYHRVVGNLEPAIECYRKVVEMKLGEAVPGFPDPKWIRAEALLRLGAIYSFLEEEDLKIFNISQAIDLFESLWKEEPQGEEDKHNNALVSYALGQCWFQLGIYEAAARFFSSARGELEESTDPDDVIRWISSIELEGLCYYERGEYEQAFSKFSQALELYHERHISRLNEVILLMHMAVCKFHLGQYQTALDLADQAMALAEKTLVSPSKTFQILAELYYQLGQIYDKTGDISRAIEEWEKAVRVIEGIRAYMRQAYLKQRYLGVNLGCYSALIRAFYTLRESEEVLQYIERAKARTLVDMMETAMITQSEFLPSETQTASELLKELGGLYEVVEEPSLDVTHGPSEARADIVYTLQWAQEQYEAVLNELERENPVLGETLSVNPDRLWERCQDVRKSMGRGVVALEYFVTDKETLLLVITREGVQTSSVIPISRAELTDRLREFREEVNTAPSPGEEATRALQARALGKELYDLLIAPVEEYLQTASHLVIVPSDVLFYLPFGALFRCPGCGTKRELWGGEYLIGRYSISYAPSLASLYWPFKHRGDGVYYQALVVGNPTGDLEYAGEEAQGIASLFPRAELVVGDAGTKDTVLGLIGGGNYDVIHLATHGEFDRELPLASRVYFNQWEPLYAGEMLGLGLRGCELVVLSACQTGLPPEVTQELVLGDELQGLSQALFVAGTPSALLTLWNVNDQSTRQLMEKMYKELMGGVPKGEALRRAQLSLLRNTMYRHPYFWAPFVLYGVWR